MTEEERFARIEAAVRSEREAKPERSTWPWWWLSFADEEGFRGVCVVRAPGVASAMVLTHAMQINPGGQVEASELLDWADIPGEYTDRLLSRSEAEALNAWDIARRAKH